MKIVATKIAKLLYCSIVVIAAFLLFTKIAHAANDHLLINEIYPAPISGCDTIIDPNCANEWIELHNPTSDLILLNDYYLIDDEKTSKEASLSKFSQIPPLSYFVLKKSENDFIFILSNTEESIFLKKKTGGSGEDQIVDAVSYGDTTAYPQNAKAPPAGKSITRKSGALDTGNDSIDFIIADPTSGAEFKEAIIDPNNEAKTIEDARGMENGEEVKLTGVVTALPGTLSSQYFYIQDETGGIQVYCYGKDFPSLALGDKISVSGELSETSNERRIKISGADKIIIQNHTNPVVPTEISIFNIGEKQEGTYVQTAGIVTETSGDTFTISDGTSEIKVAIRKGTGIDKPKMKKGDEVEVTGIVSQYKNDYRILPIAPDDVKIISSVEQLPRAGNGEFIYIILSLFSTILWNIYLIAKRKLLTLQRRLRLLRVLATYSRFMAI